jgi:hypothetical protein
VPHGTIALDNGIIYVTVSVMERISQLTRDESLAQTVAGNVRAEMARAEFGVATVADAIGISAVQLRTKLRGSRDFSLDEVAAVAETLDLPLERLLGYPCYRHAPSPRVEGCMNAHTSDETRFVAPVKHQGGRESTVVDATEMNTEPTHGSEPPKLENKAHCEQQIDGDHTRSRYAEIVDSLTHLVRDQMNNREFTAKRSVVLPTDLAERVKLAQLSTATQEYNSFQGFVHGALVRELARLSVEYNNGVIFDRLDSSGISYRIGRPSTRSTLKSSTQK